jgi:hypothetical protein
MQNLQFGIEQRCNGSGHEAGSGSHYEGEKWIEPMGNGHGGYGRPQRQAAIHG